MIDDGQALMNTLINNHHDTFFHRNCPGSTKSRYLMDGVAEIAWYCPAGKHSDAFINENRDPVKTKKGKYIMGLKDKSHSDVSEQLKMIIREVLSSLDGPILKPSFQLETMAELSGIRVDEADPACQRGKSAAMKINYLLKKDNMDVSKIKDKFLPCQGQLWHQWSKIHRELFKLSGNIEKEKSDKEEELMNIRQKQCAASCSKLMELFIEGLSSLPGTDREYFLKWTQIFIDALSTDDLSSILKSYDEKWSEVLALKNKWYRSDLLLKTQTELENISKKHQSLTFGLEHIFREMGQIYEAHKTTQRESRHSDWSKYPELAAQLMISGHPMELMDGDAGHVPLTWISSLLEEVIRKLGDQRVFVLSVLGLQSSGKSTMLNTMFGLQFAVSAGRCTKGAFMQLLKVSEEMKKDLKFDYVLVVDTEGLCALELEGNNLHHDNELATFVVGLGNLTLINIFGENLSEMQDILQIVVQAFMRMKGVKLSPSCVFVHQNVTDVAAAEKNMDRKRRLQEKLDQMAKLAAEEEVCDAECFSDVIEFDVQTDVKYCAQLWEGSPPMAPPNPGYSESIQEVKNTILSKASKSAGITLSQFKTNIKDLWTALLTKSFVFSFKNTLEIAVYENLMAQYGNWTWTLRSNMLTIENQLHNRIENGKLDEVDEFYLFKETSKIYEEVKKEMKMYLKHKEKVIFSQWQEHENKINELYKEEVNRVKVKLDGVIHHRKAHKMTHDRKSEFENKLLQKIKELSHKLKDKAKDEEELQRQFNSVWSSWVTELTADIKPVEDINLEIDQLTILQELGFEPTLIDECKRSGRYKKISHFGDYSDYIMIRGQMSMSRMAYHKHVSFGLFSYEEQEIRSFIDQAHKNSLDAIKSNPVVTRGYSSAYLREVANHVTIDLWEFLSEKNYTLNKEFTVDLLMYVFYRAESWLLQSHKKFKMSNDPITYLESKKTHYYTVFRSFCEGNSSAVVLGELICEKLKVSTLEAVCNKTAIDLAGRMRCNFPAFNGNRLNLDKYLLRSLAKKENFDDFITYINNPRRQTEAFIKAEVQQYIYMSHKDEAVNILKKNVDDIETTVSQALFTATQKVQNQRGDTDMWLNEFCNVLKDELTFDICSENFSDINNFHFLKEEIEKGFTSIIKQMSRLSLDKLNESRQRPEEILIDQLCNCCWVKCPFCAAVCINTMKDHSPDDHSTPFHRPDGIIGSHYVQTKVLSISF
ncbi:interferon-induced very large GTPase 1-like [Haplochromis burtoni]|uniref:interferon-induced very large GTPase 1-like n=1 Tax=Haplochromis burtoni TaxID=8153 RepID=UPI001C2D3611|nr:interferon-induced very large GTPase 1-like [Haplochromis burtoni]